MTRTPKKGFKKEPKKEDSKARIIAQQRKEIRKLVKENKKLKSHTYDLNKILEKSLRRIEELSIPFTVEQLLNIDKMLNVPIVDIDNDDPNLSEEDIDAIAKLYKEDL